MSFGARHLPEDRLFDCYLAEQTGERMEPPSAEHLSDCAECAARYGDLRRFMDGLRSDADAELDELFPIERLRNQQQQILRRVEHLTHPARVISFPGRPGRHSAAASHRRLAPRWLGAAAAAGLLIGIASGSFFYGGTPGGTTRQVATSGTPSVQPATLAVAPQAALQDVDRNDVSGPSELNDQFFSELERALERPHTPELIALDDLTPHVREIRAQLR